jgi:hypothetical protein
MDTNFMVCSVDTVGTDGVVTIIPFKNTYSSVTEAWTSELTNLESSIWAWKVKVVIGTDRNMFFVSFYPVGEDLANTHYLVEIASNKFFTHATSPTTVIKTASTAFNVDGLLHSEYLIGATGVDSKITMTLTGASNFDWIANPKALAQICGDPTYLMGSNAGAVNEGVALDTTVAKTCLKFTQSILISTTTTNRECWYCPLSASSAKWAINSFKIPVTKERTVKGFSM